MLFLKLENTNSSIIFLILKLRTPRFRKIMCCTQRHAGRKMRVQICLVILALEPEFYFHIQNWLRFSNEQCICRDFLKPFLITLINSCTTRVFNETSSTIDVRKHIWKFLNNAGCYFLKSPSFWNRNF